MISHRQILERKKLTLQRQVGCKVKGEKEEEKRDWKKRSSSLAAKIGRMAMNDG